MVPTASDNRGPGGYASPEAPNESRVQLMRDALTEPWSDYLTSQQAGEFLGALVMGLLVAGLGVFLMGPGARLILRQNKWLRSELRWLPSQSDAASLWVSRLVGAVFVVAGLWIISLSF